MVLATVMEELGLPTSGDPMRLPEELNRILHRSWALAKQALVCGVQEAFTLTRSHYNGICFDQMALGFPDEYSTEALDALVTKV